MEKSKVIDKVKKLLALSESSDIHEASLASLKAKALIEEYKIEQYELNKAYKSNVESWIIKHGHKNPPLWLLDLHKGLSDFLHGAALIHKELPIFIFVGEEEDYAIYDYLYNYISRQVRLQTYKFQQERIKESKKDITNEIASYAVGLVSNLIDRLKEKDVETTGTELVLLRKNEIQKFLDKVKPNKVNPDISGLSYKQFAQGVSDGKKIPLQKAVSEEDVDS